MTTLCVACGKRPPRHHRTRCGMCANRRQYGTIEAQIVPRNSAYAPPPSRRGEHGDRCPRCNQLLSFGTVDGVAVEWCPTHGALVTPLERRDAGPVYDQRTRLERELARDVDSELRPLAQIGQRRHGPSIRVGRG